MGEHERLLIWGVRLDEDYRTRRIGDITLQDVERDVVRIAPLLPRYFSLAPMRVLREGGVFEKHDPVPAATRDDALVLAHPTPAFR